MPSKPDPFAERPGFDLEARIRERAGACCVALDAPACAALALHARSVLRDGRELHLTSIDDPEEFLERHLGESFEGAAMLPAGVEGSLLDLGSGNGYPGLPLAVARPGLRVLLAEASHRKAAFLNTVLRRTGLTSVRVLPIQVQRPTDLTDVEPLRVLTTRAMGGWAKILPRLGPCLRDDGEMLVWAGEELEVLARREAWRRLRVADRRALPGRERSWVWRVGRA